MFDPMRVVDNIVGPDIVERTMVCTRCGHEVPKGPMLKNHRHAMCPVCGKTVM